MASVRKRTWTTAKDEAREAWTLRYRDANRVQQQETFATKGEARDRRNAIEQSMKAGTHTVASAKTTLSEAAEAWISGGEAKKRERSTIVQRREHLKHIFALVPGETRLAKLHKPQVVELRDGLLKEHSPALARKVWTSFRSLLRDARERGLMSHDPSADVRLDTNGRHKRPPLREGVDFPTPAEVKTLIEAAEGFARALIVVLVFTGLRISEALALTWGDLDFKARMVHVRQRANKWGETGPVKSETSFRAIPMTPLLESTLELWRGERIYPNEALVFGTGAGTPWSQANVWNRVLGPLQRKAGVVDRHGKPKYGAHAFRHQFASWRLHQGDGLKRVSVLMGHANTVITATTYEHLITDQDQHERFAAGEKALLGS